jgi:hypothetical protein
VQAEDRLGYVRYLSSSRSKSHNVDIGVAPRVVKGMRMTNYTVVECGVRF